MKKTMKKAYLATVASITLLFAFASCDSLQDSLSSEQLADQKEGIGSLSADSAVYYFNGTESGDISGTEAHLVLNLSQIANADDAAVSYNLAYTMGSKDDKKDYTTSGSVKGTLSESKSKYYVDLSPAINLIDGEKNPAYSDISYTVTVSGLKNASGNDYDGRTFPTFTQSVKFAPLYNSEIATFSTKSAPAGTTFEIPLNGKITAVDPAVTATATDGTLPSTTFTASVSADGTKIVVTTSEAISGEEFTADLALTGIKTVGAKEAYSHTFSGVQFAANSIILDGKLDEEDWSASTVATSEDSYSDGNTYQNMKKVYVTNDTKYLYVAVEFAETPGGNKTNINLSFTTGADNGSASDDSGWMTPATTTTFSNGTLDFKAYENIAWIANDATNQRGLSNLSASGVCGPTWNAEANGYTNDSKIIEYSIKLSDLSVSLGDKVKLFASISQYSYSSENHETLLDCIPSAAASVTDSGETVSVDFSKALEYTIQ